MTLGDKIKHVLRGDKSGSGTTTGVTSSGGQSTPDTGPDAYRPLKDSATGNTGTGEYASGTTGAGGATGTGAGTGSTGGRGLTGASPSSSSSSDAAYNAASGQSGSVGGTSQGQRGVGSGVGTGKTGTGSGTRDESSISRFSKGYGAEGDRPGYDTTFKGGDPVYHERVTQGDDGSWSADLGASGGQEDWERARELTLAAEREAAEAKLSGGKANKELAAAEAAEDAVRKAQAKHREALLEAEKYRALINDPSDKEASLHDAEALYRQKQSALEDARRLVQEAEAELAGKRRDAEKLHPEVDKYGQVIPGLESEYERRLRERQAAEGDREKLLLEAQNAEKDHSGLLASLQGLESEVERAEREAAIKQQEYIDARNRAQSAATRLDELRERLRAAEAALSGYQGRARDADSRLPQFREAEDRALRDLENSKSEWYRLRDLEDQYVKSFEDAHRRHKGLLGSTDPADKDLRDASSLLSARQDDLDRARSRSVQAESKYRDLLNLAERHKKYGDSAANAAAQHGQSYEALRKEAAIHGDKHVQLWNEAKNYGEHGSTEASSAVRKLEEKVKDLMNKNEP